MHAVRLRPSGLWIGWDSQNLYWASSRELLGSTPATSRQALTRGLLADQHPWLQIPAPELGWLSVHLPQTRLPYRVGWLWPWQAWGLYRRWHRLWLLAHSRALLHQTRQLQAQCRGRYLRQAQWPSIRQQADAILNTHHQLRDQTLAKPVATAWQWLLKLQQPAALQRLQQSYCRRMVRHYAPLFDSLEQHPLTTRQREACVLDEAANLVLAGAGSGKTSVLAGRVAYLLASGLARPDEILLLAFGKQAADEMRERIASRLPETQEASAPSPEISTFHALGLAIIQAVEGKRPALSPLAEGSGARLPLVQDAFEVALQDPNYRSRVLEYLRRYLYPRTDPMQFTERAGYLAKLAAEELKSLKGEMMYSLAEVQIANWLFRQGIEYCYQHPWPLPLKHSSHQEVLPQFFLPESGVWLRHLTLDRRVKALPWQDASAYQAAAVALSQTGGAPVIIDTYYWQWQSNRLEKVLQKELEQRQIPWQPLPEEAVLATLREWGRLQELVEQLNEMLGYYKAGCFDSARLKQQLAQSTEPARAKAALVLLRPLFERYQQELKRTRSMDFDDMIGLAIEHVANGRFISPWRQILVDEFQDISEPRARLLRLLRDQHPESALFCVGDDWQAIYRFTGADLRLTTDFADYFGPAAITALDKTFRFNNAIGEVANRFVQVNPAQLRKPLVSLLQVDEARVTLHWLDKAAGRGAEPAATLETLLSQMARSVTTPPTSVLLLARFRFSLPDAVQLQQWQQQFPQLSIAAMTLHGAKGREADQVILCGLESGRHGLPSEKETHPLIAALLPKAEVFAHAEERRLLYVGLTRARQQVFLLADRARPSPFVQELLTEGYRLDVARA